MAIDKKEQSYEGINEKIQSSTIQSNKIQTSEKPEYKFDKLKLMFREDYTMNNGMIISQPSLGDIVDFGEREYYGTTYTMCSIPSDYKSFLWDMGIDWNKISDFELFIMLYGQFNSDAISLLLKDITISEFIPVKHNVTGDLALFNPNNQIVINEDDYLEMIEYIRLMHGITYKREKAKNKFTRDVLIQEDRENRERVKNKKQDSSILYNYISSMLVYPGFKYKSNELKQCGIFEFMDAVQRAQIFVSTDALLKGMYSGMIDTKDIKKEQFNWLRDIG